MLILRIEPNELPDCSTPRRDSNKGGRSSQGVVRLLRRCVLYVYRVYWVRRGDTMDAQRERRDDALDAPRNRRNRCLDAPGQVDFQLAAC